MNSMYNIQMNLGCHNHVHAYLSFNLPTQQNVRPFSSQSPKTDTLLRSSSIGEIEYAIF
jgi:hypothetical protein